MPSLKHTHTLIRSRRDKAIYQCADPHCTFKGHKDDLYGKASICAVCGNAEIVMGYEEFKRAKPNCENCSNRKDIVERRERSKQIESIFEGL